MVVPDRLRLRRHTDAAVAPFATADRQHERELGLGDIDVDAAVAAVEWRTEVSHEDDGAAAVIDGGAGVVRLAHRAERRRVAERRGERLAIVGAPVVAGKIGKVEGKARVHFYDRNKPVEEGKPDYQSVGHGGSYDLVARKILEPGK